MMSTSTNLRAAQTGDDRITSKKLEVTYSEKKLLVVTLSAIISTIVARLIVAGAPKGPTALSKRERARLWLY